MDKTTAQLSQIDKLLLKDIAREVAQEILDNQERKCDFYTPQELADKLNMSIKFINSNSYKILGRTKMGRMIRYRKIDIEKALIRGKLLA